MWKRIKVKNAILRDLQIQARINKEQKNSYAEWSSDGEI